MMIALLLVKLSMSECIYVHVHAADNYLPLRISCFIGHFYTDLF